MNKRIAWIEIAALLVLGMSPLVQAHDKHEPARYEASHNVSDKHQGIAKLPRGYQKVRYGGHDYYTVGTQWYRPQAGRYVLISPPPGLRVNALPGKAKIVRVGHERYYQVAGVFYQPVGKGHQYQVVRAPRAPAVAWVEADNQRR